MRSQWFAAARAALLAGSLCAAGAATAAERSFDLVVASQAERDAAPRVLRVVKGDAVRLRIRGDRDGEVHLHGYRLTAHLTPGSTTELAFTAHATGRFRIEWHAAAAAASTSHHAPPLAILEVHPQ